MNNFAFPARKSIKARLRYDPNEHGLEIYSEIELVGYDGVTELGTVRFGNEMKFHCYVTRECSSIHSLLEKSTIDEYTIRSLENYLKNEFIYMKYKRPLVMAVVNATPDSFYSGSRMEVGEAALDELIDAKPDIIDIGGESTRPGSHSPSLEEEIRRLEPVVDYIKSVSDIPLSLDTRHPSVLLHFAEKITYANDVTGFRDQSMARISADHSLKCIVMHMRGEPHNMQSLTNYTDIVPEVVSYLGESASNLNREGVSRKNIIVDPGLGFSKDFTGNMELIREIQSFSFGYDTLVGASRKSFIGRITGEGPEGRLPGTLGVTAYLALNGVNIIRVHDPKENLQVLKVLENIIETGDQL